MPLKTVKDILNYQIEGLKDERNSLLDRLKTHKLNIEEVQSKIAEIDLLFKELENSITILEKSASEQVKTKKQKRDRTP